jgi:uncharacterized protein YpmS
MNKNNLLALCALTFSVLACSVFVGGPSYPSTSIPISTDAVQSLHDQVQQSATQGAQSGTITLQITESQLTSYLASYFDSQPNPLLLNPQVLLRNGQMQVFGQFQQGLFTGNASITLQVSVDANGQPKIDITQTDFGPLPAPQGLNDAISSLIQQAFTGSLGPAATGFRLDSISIADGVMTINGRIK